MFFRSRSRLADSCCLGIAAVALVAALGLSKPAAATSHDFQVLGLQPPKEAVEAHAGAEVPPHLRSTGYRGAAQLGHGAGYRYPHDHPDGIVAQQYLPDPAAGTVLYRPSQTGAEAAAGERLAEIDRRMGRKPRE